MLEIISLILLTRIVGAKAVRKGLPPGRWKLYTVLAWFAFEILGFFIGSYFLGGMGGMLQLSLFAIFCGFGGYLFIKARLDKIPDTLNDDIDRIGQ